MIFISQKYACMYERPRICVCVCETILGDLFLSRPVYYANAKKNMSERRSENRQTNICIKGWPINKFSAIAKIVLF